MPEHLGLPREGLIANAVVPVSLQLAAGLRWAIIQRELPVGYQLPSEPELAEWFSTSRDTVSRAYGILRAAGVVATRRGKGHFVAYRPDFQRVEVPPGATVIVKRPSAPEERIAIGPDAAALYTPIIVVTRPGQPDEIYDATSTAIVTIP
jgi:DNA-binding FadR family transcriptional regulator